MLVATAAPLAAKVGAVGYGALIGWYVYYVNRFRTDKIQLTDVAGLGGAIGGAAVLKLFPAGSDLFGFYGIGLAIGFFGYFATLVILVALSKGEFAAGWFLDGRRKNPTPADVMGYGDPQHPMASRSGGT